MPSDDPLSPDEVHQVVAESCFPRRDDERSPGRIGLEVERFPIRSRAAGRPEGRVRIDGGTPDSLSVLDGLAGEAIGVRGEVGGIPSYPVPGGGRLTFEPGGVLEHATAVHDTAAGALDEVERLGPVLATAFDDEGVLLASAGTDPWHDVADVPLQLDCFRYPAMAEYFDRRGPQGRIIMRHTCSVQVNLDLGLESERTERWTLANLLAPLLTATFASSPAGDDVCARARAWQALDLTRTGFPRRLLDGSTDDPVAQLADAALEADVLLVRTGPDSAEPGVPGWSFGDWLAHGHPERGRPTAADLDYHLSTVFHEVRPRGMLELRCVDAVPQRWRDVPVTLVAGAIEDRGARSRLLELLAPRRGDLLALWHHAAGRGVDDPSFCALAVEAWSYAMEGAGRLPAGYLPDGALAVAEEYLERFALRGRCPADELRDELHADRAAALAWAAEPIPQRAREAR